jgi:hypothetical protein
MRLIRLLIVSGVVAVAVGCAKDQAPAGGSGGRVAGSGGSSGSGGASAGTGGAPSGSGGRSAGSGGTTLVGSGGAGAGSGGTSGGSGGSASGSGGGENVDAGGADRICQEAMYKFEPQIPTVLVLVDRSGTVFDTNVYGPLREAVLDVVMRLQGEVRFGLGVFTGDLSAGTNCPMFTSVAANLNNFTAIMNGYPALNAPRPMPAETPFSLITPMVKQVLQADRSPGQKYVLFVTDSETDYCSNRNPACPLDTALYRIQDLYAAGFGTFILGIPGDITDPPTVATRTAALQAFANAGAGLPIGEPRVTGGQPPQLELTNMCLSDPDWARIRTEAMRTGSVPTATYMAPAGNARVFMPSGTDRTALANAISAVIAGVKSCVFDLSNVGGRSIKVDLMMLDKARVMVMGAEVPRNDTNGWRMNSATVLELAGTACTNWRAPQNTDIKFEFPCSAIIFE